ncbi:MerR family DNA-binding transcriptional regulator [Streptomyces diacarni]|uniref:MerR family DNA-binding transcriptional regulator n=1 Tax=Streptomyces diacarni TaxID=2800381 RepID=UPI0033D4FAE3
MDELARDDGTGRLWFTVRQAAAFLGRSVQTIYSWERRGTLTDPRRDEHGRRIYTQAQLAAAERAVRPRAARVLDSRAA